MRELIRNDQGRQQLRGLLLAGAATASTAPMDEACFDRLRQRVRKTARRHRKA